MFTIFKESSFNPISRLCHVIYYHSDKNYPCLVGIGLSCSSFSHSVFSTPSSQPFILQPFLLSVVPHSAVSRLSCFSSQSFLLSAVLPSAVFRLSRFSFSCSFSQTILLPSVLSHSAIPLSAVHPSAIPSSAFSYFFFSDCFRSSVGVRTI